MRVNNSPVVPPPPPEGVERYGGCQPGHHQYERVPEQVLVFGMGTTITLFCRNCGHVIVHPLKNNDDKSS